jgi:hypothetical protein
MAKAPAKPARAAAVLLYLPGLGHFPRNTAEGVADVIARTLDRRRAGRYRSVDSTAAAPTGLRVGKTVVGPDGEPLLEVYEVDFRHRLEDLDPLTAQPTLPPGVTGAAWDSVQSLRLLLPALRRPAKCAKAKIQLLMGLLAAILLLMVAAVSLVAALTAMGLVDSLGWLAKGNTDRVVAIGGGVTVAGIWTKARPGLLAMAGMLHRLLRYFKEDRHRATVTQTVDDAVDGLLDDGWTAPLHVLGYSFGSLVAFDFLFPPAGGPDRLGAAVASLTTVGCPLDTMRLYFPDYLGRRTPRAPGIPWRNVFIPADVLGSTFDDGEDVEAGSAAVMHAATGVAVESIRYTNEKLDLLGIVRGKGFRTHGGYWDHPDNASCFDLLVDLWVPPAA